MFLNKTKGLTEAQKRALKQHADLEFNLMKEFLGKATLAVGVSTHAKHDFDIVIMTGKVDKRTMYNAVTALVPKSNPRIMKLGQ